MRSAFPAHMRKHKHTQYTPDQHSENARKLQQAHRELRRAAQEEILDIMGGLIADIQEEGDYELAGVVRLEAIEIATRWGFKSRPGLF